MKKLFTFLLALVASVGTTFATPMTCAEALAMGNALKANDNPRTAVYHDYTFTVISDGCEGFAVPFIIGDMTTWNNVQMQLDVEATMANGAPTYYYNCKCAEGTRYQILSGLMADDGTIAEYPTWDNPSYLEQLVDDVWSRYTEDYNGEPNVDLYTGANANITFDVRKENFRWNRCAESIPEDPYTVNVTLAAPAGAPSAVEIIGDFDNWMGTHMIFKNGVYTATVTATPSQKFKFRKAGTWDNEILVFDWEAGGWKGFPDTQFQSVWEPAAEKGKMAINLDLSDPTMYKWKSKSASENWGYNLTWALSNGVLTITGTGSMSNFSNNTPPWDEYSSSIQSVVINDGVTSIGDLAFSGCSSLTSVTIPNSVTSIGDLAFSGCSKLTSPIYNAHCFAYMPTSYSGAYTIPEGIKQIAGGAFSYCSKLTSVTIPNSVTSIGDYAFYNCSSLTSVAIPNSVTSIGYRAFSGCSKLTSPIYNAHCFGYMPTSYSGAYTIPEGIKQIAGGAFYGCSSLISITIPNSLTSIGKSAFYGCSSLTSVVINSDAIVNKAYTSSSNLSGIFGSQVTKYIIGDNVKGIGGYAFYNCSSLTSITIPNSVTSIGSYAFDGCSKLTSPIYNAHCFAYMPTSYSGAYTIPEGIKQIAGGAFSYCSKLTSVTIPNSVTSIGNRAFEGCSKLTSVTIGNGVTSIGDGAFKECSSLTSITIPESVTFIGDYVFQYCSSLTSVTIGNGVTSIEWNTFSGCSSLTSITIPNSVTSIGSSAFEGCSSLTSVTIGNGVTSIEWDTFYGCSKLTSVTINSDAIVNKAYTSSSNLSDIFRSQVTEYIIGDNVKGIGHYAFDGCSSLASVTIPNSVTSIGECTFRDCSSLTSVTIPNSMTSIGNRAFEGCNNITSVTWNAKNCNTYNFGSQVTSFEFGNEVEVVPSSLCKGMEKLTSISIPNSVTSIGDEAFSGCSSLTSVHITDLAAWCNIDLGAYSANPLYYAHKLYLNGELVKDLVIPNSVTSIGDYAFYNSSSLTSFTIPNSVTSIGDEAFSGCSSLTSIHITDLAAWCKISFGSATANPLYYAHNLYLNGELVKDLVIPNSVTSIGDYAFYNSSSLTSFTIPNSVTNIGNRAFEGCNNIASVTWNAKNCNSYNFGSQVASFEFGNEVEVVPSSLCKGMEKLTSITIPNSVKTIGASAFKGCARLGEVSLGKGLENIGANAFAECTRLYDIYVYATYPPFAEVSSFANYNVYVYIPCEYKRDYTLDVVWGKFKFIECISSDNVTTDEIVVTPSENEANVIWPSVSGAASYELVIKDKNGNIVCTLIFNANGQLTSIAFNAPSRNGVPTQTQNAGFSFTITGLDSGTNYDLTLTAKDNSGNTIEETTIPFHTDYPEGIEDVQGDETQSTKVIKDGQILILRNGKTYTMQGQEVK